MLEGEANLEKITTPIFIEEAIVRSSIQIITTENDNSMPSGFGTGFILVYKDRMFLTTVHHVIKDQSLKIRLEADLDSENVLF